MLREPSGPRRDASICSSNPPATRRRQRLWGVAVNTGSVWGLAKDGRQRLSASKHGRQRKGAREMLRPPSQASDTLRLWEPHLPSTSSSVWGLPKHGRQRTLGR